MAQHAMITKPGQGCCLANVSYSRTLNQHHAFPDDRVEFQVEIVNRKPLPLTSLRVVETVAAALDWGDTPLQYHEKPSLRLLERTTSLRWYEALRWRYQVRCPQRGAFAFGPTTLQAGDPFGFTTQELTVTNLIELVVYPRLLPLAELGLTARHPLGDVRSRQWLFADPIRTIGARDYRQDDPLKSIHWTATAHSGRLQTRVYEPTTSLELLIFLDLDTFTHYWEGTDPAQVERAISAAATLAKVGLEERYSVGLIVNGMQERQDGIIRIRPGRSLVQLDRIFDALARLKGCGPASYRFARADTRRSGWPSASSARRMCPACRFGMRRPRVRLGARVQHGSSSAERSAEDGHATPVCTCCPGGVGPGASGLGAGPVTGPIFASVGAVEFVRYQHRAARRRRGDRRDPPLGTNAPAARSGHAGNRRRRSAARQERPWRRIWATARLGSGCGCAPRPG